MQMELAEYLFMEIMKALKKKLPRLAAFLEQVLNTDNN